MPSHFARELKKRQPDPTGRRWVYVPYDQLSDEIGPLAAADPREIGIVLAESPAKAARRPYHKQKLALVLANQRHFALEQAARGVAVRYVAGPGSYADLLAPLARELGPLEMMRPAERELRVDLRPLVDAGGLVERPHEGWLTSTAQFEASQQGPPWRMDAFYRHVRRETGVLMTKQGKPEGGKFSFDAENRQAWAGSPPAPKPPSYTPNEITKEVGELVDRQFADHPGVMDLASLAASRQDAETAWAWARRRCLPHFGPYEDAMSTQSSGLFHTRVSPLLNLHRLLPSRVVGDVAGLDIPLSSKEGFIRQVLGWREFVRHVHEASDGFRHAPAGPLAGSRPLPAVFWGTRSGLRCLDQVVSDVWREGWSHHITRLMVLSNLATLLDLSPRELTDWFWVAYVDAFDWVVEPNVLGMGTYAFGDLMTTKPYVSGAAYIDRLSDYCRTCASDPKTTCPITPLYWAFLARHRQALGGNIRMAMPIRSLAKRPAAKRKADAETFERVSRTLAAGDLLVPTETTKARGVMKVTKSTKVTKIRESTKTARTTRNGRVTRG